jgi:uncharacterized protein (DUF58 family)
VNPHTRVYSFLPRTWFGRFFALLVGFALLLTAALFATIALVAGAIVALVVLARAWWLLRKAEKRRASRFLRAEYTVEPDESARLLEEWRRRAAGRGEN